jgi:hypothetical protein
MLTVLRGSAGFVPRGPGPGITYIVTGPGPFGPIVTSGPTTQPWQLTVGIELALVVLGTVGTVLLLRERRRLGRGPG